MGEWVVIELNPRSEGEDPDVVADALRVVLGQDAEIFLPAVVTEANNNRVFQWLVDGYAFVRRDKEDSLYLKLEHARYVNRLLTQGGRKREFATVKDVEIERMRAQVAEAAHQGIGIGDVVRVISGSYRNITAMVVEEIPERDCVQIYVKLRSKQDIVELPRSFLTVVERSPLSSFFSRISSLKRWIHMARPILEWDSERIEQLDTLADSYEQILEWGKRGRNLYAFVRFVERDFSSRLEAMEKGLGQLEQAEGWLEQVGPRVAFIRSFQDDVGRNRLLLLEQRLLDLAWTVDTMERLRDLQDEIAALRKRVRGDVTAVQNVVIDGHNLAFRCLFAPGIKDLKDEQGRPTGMILGFLRSVAALKKRFSEARIIVTWDGSSQRRKNQCSTYKANRTSKLDEMLSQLVFIREILPKIGVEQAWHPEEEADDVIATLVRGELAEQVNVMFSTDRDLLQLVTDMTYLLIPQVGSRKEKHLNSSEAVVKEMGVPPGQVIHFRAFNGDKSDQIPGVPRVPKKVLLSLVRQHGTVDGVYRSSLAGTTRIQYERLHQQEPQVRLNLELMRLLDVPLTWTPADLDVDAAAEMLQGVDINPNPLVDTFQLRL